MRKYLTSDEIEKMSKMSSAEISELMKKKYPLSDEEECILSSMHSKLVYYKIVDLNLIGKMENGLYYLYKNGKWVLDENIISDRIIGYDGELIGTSTMHDIIEIESNKAELLIKDLYD